MSLNSTSLSFNKFRVTLHLMSIIFSFVDDNKGSFVLTAFSFLTHLLRWKTKVLDVSHDISIANIYGLLAIKDR